MNPSKIKSVYKIISVVISLLLLASCDLYEETPRLPREMTAIGKTVISKIAAEDYNGAILDATQEIRRWEKDGDKFADIIGDAYILRSQAYEKSGDYRSAIEDYTSGINQFEKYAKSYLVLSDPRPFHENYVRKTVIAPLYDARGSLYMKNKQATLAEKDFARAKQLRSLRTSLW